MICEYRVIGSPVGHSLSPAIHTRLYEIYGIEGCRYSAEEVTKESLPAFIGRARAGEACGFNVTMPLKAEIIPYLDSVVENAAASVNTVVRSDGALNGYSTDQAGFYRSLIQAGGDYAGRNIVFIGCGAAARGLIADAAERGARGITVLNRTPGKARFAGDESGADVDAIANISKYMDGCDVLINTTPLGMSGTGADFEDISFVEMLPKGALVCDLIYSPPETRLLAAARTSGHKTLNGLPMLVWQAFYAFELFFGILPGEAEYAEVMKALSRRQDAHDLKN